MALDDPSAGAAGWFLALSMMTFPISCFVAIFVANWLNRRGNRWAVAPFLLPLLNVLVGGGAILWVQYVRGGRP